MSSKLGLFRLANCGYAIPVERLLRIVDCGFSTALPLIPSFMAGMLVLDDEIVPLLDSNWLPEVVAGKSLSASFKILITTEYGSVALPADATVGILEEDRCVRITSDQETVKFVSDSIRYRDSCYQVIDIDLFMMSLIRP